MARPNIGDLIPIGAVGNATQSDVLSGKTFSSEEGVDITGTMPNRGAISNTITTQNGRFAIPQGYHNGGGIVKAQLTFKLVSIANVEVSLGIGPNESKTVHVPVEGIPYGSSIICIGVGSYQLVGYTHNGNFCMKEKPPATMALPAETSGESYIQIFAYYDDITVHGVNNEDHEYTFAAQNIQVLYLLP